MKGHPKRTLPLAAAGALLALSVLTAGCGESLRYGETISSQTTLDASRTQNAVTMDVIRNSNQIMSLLTNGKSNAFSVSQLQATLTSEMNRTQEAMNKLEKYRQPNSLQDEFEKSFQALSNYKSALLFLREALKTKTDVEEEKKQLINAISVLQSTHYVQP